MGKRFCLTIASEGGTLVLSEHFRDESLSTVYIGHTALGLSLSFSPLLHHRINQKLQRNIGLLLYKTLDYGTPVTLLLCLSHCETGSRSRKQDHL